jgi:phosphoenolpyruvate carboxylase
VFYNSASSIVNYLQENIFKGKEINNSIFDFGFWPGGDRDGNPFVNSDITLKTSNKLRSAVLNNYFKDIKKLKRRLTFDKISNQLQTLQDHLHDEIYNVKSNPKITVDKFLSVLISIKKELNKSYFGLYQEKVTDLINKVTLFGFHFASLDIRQNSRVHSKVFNNICSMNNSSIILKNDYKNLSDFTKEINKNLDTKSILSQLKSKESKDTINSINVMRMIQDKNGEKACNRYIISNCSSLDDIMNVFILFKMCGWNSPSVDIIPLFETIDDLKNSEEILKDLYNIKEYRDHLKKRGDKQTVMLGFSDGTKDGGYLMANWSIYKTKISLSKISDKFKIKTIFFDGRGGPPARGGGNTHEFYSSLDNSVHSDDIQLTVQGQTISSNFGTIDSSKFNLEQLLSSGISNKVLRSDKNKLTKKNYDILNTLAMISYKSYKKFKSHPKFLSYLEEITTLRYYSKTNIGSRPSKRNKSLEFIFEDLRAIPFVGSWSQSKQNVPGFYGVGTALNYFKVNDDFSKLKKLYKKSLFFRTLISNSMMSLTKSFFKLTHYLSNDEKYGEFWKLIYDEYILTDKLILELTDFAEIMQNEDAGKASILAREEIVQPLITIQQYALMNINKANEMSLTKTDIMTFEKMVIRSMFGNINASRNSA